MCLIVNENSSRAYLLHQVSALVQGNGLTSILQSLNIESSGIEWNNDWTNEWNNENVIVKAERINKFGFIDLMEAHPHTRYQPSVMYVCQSGYVTQEDPKSFFFL